MVRFLSIRGARMLTGQNRPLLMAASKADFEAVEQAFEPLLETAFLHCFAVRRGCIFYDAIEVWKSLAFDD